VDRRARLALGLRGWVQRPRVVLAPADHRPDLARVVVERDERRGLPVRVREVAPDRVLGRLLEFGVERRRDLQAALEGAARAEAVDELLADPGREVRRGRPD